MLIYAFSLPAKLKNYTDVYSQKLKNWNIILLNCAQVLRKNSETSLLKKIYFGNLKLIIDEAKSPAPSGPAN